jgi:hypothetical protein
MDIILLLIFVCILCWVYSRQETRINAIVTELILLKDQVLQLQGSRTSTREEVSRQAREHNEVRDTMAQRNAVASHLAQQQQVHSSHPDSIVCDFVILCAWPSAGATLPGDCRW